MFFFVLPVDLGCDFADNICMLNKKGKVDLDQLADFRKPDNGFVGRRVDGSSIVSVNVGDNPDIIKLMVSHDVSAWDKFCDMIGDMDPRGQVHIDWLFVDGVAKEFH